MATVAADVMTDVRTRVDDLDWHELEAQLDEVGHAVTPVLLDGRGLPRAGRAVRRRPVSLDDRHGPPSLRRGPVPLLRSSAARAHRSAARLVLPPPGDGGQPLERAPARRHADVPESRTRSCSSAAARPGRRGPRPLILRYGPGDWNALHQDLYGEVFFPFQILTVLSRRGADFEGGEFVLMEQRPARRAAPTCSPRRRARLSSSPPASAPARAARAITASACATASRRSRRAAAPHWG